MALAFLQSIFPLSPLSLRSAPRISAQSGLKDFCLLYLLCSVILLNLQTSFAQETKRPKIGLVLSGGGAKGFAHIGVLKVLEQAGIKIDYIGGTSMGAVVGGLYASGYNAAQIDSIFKATSFDELLKDYIPRSSKSFYEKRNDELYSISLPFNKLKVGIPVALSKGMYNYNLLNKLTHKVRNTNDFSQLPIPFVCVATDIETGKEVLLKNGYLAQALLASSAFPTLFSPVEIDGKLLVDGGVSNNYPVEEVRKMGADIIIGVDVQDDLKDRKSLKEATRILVQITNLQMIEKMKDKIGLTNIYIKPDISNYGVISFDQGQEIIKKGEEATFAVYEKIKALANPANENKIQYLKKSIDSVSINHIEINDLQNYTRAYVMGKLDFKANKKISYQDLNIGINQINATQNFSAISYILNKSNDRENNLILNLTENNTKTFLKFGLHYDGLYKSALLTNLTQKKSLFKNDVASLDIILGDNFRYNFDYYIDNGFYWSFGFKSRFNNFNKNVATDFSNGTLLSLFGLSTININFSDITNQAYVQTVFAQKFQLGLGLEFKHLKIKSETLQNTTQLFENSDYYSAFGYLKFDSFDNKYFPKKGVCLSGDYQYYLYSSNFSGNFNPFSIAKADAAIAKTFYKKATIKLQSEAGVSIGQTSVSYLDFVLGGYGYSPTNNFKNFYGYDYLSIAGNSFIKASATLDYEIAKKNHLNFCANFANINDNIFRGVDWLSKPKYSGYAVGYGLETVVGPIEVKYTWSPELSRGFTWFTVGFWF